MDPPQQAPKPCLALPRAFFVPTATVSSAPAAQNPQPELSLASRPGQRYHLERAAAHRLCKRLQRKGRRLCGSRRQRGTQMAGATLGGLVACCRCSGVPLAANVAAAERTVMSRHRAASLPPRAAATPCLRRGGRPALQPQQPWQPLARPVRRRRQHAQPPQALALPEALSALEASPARDFAAAMFAVAGSVALIKFFDTLERMGVIDKVRAAVMGDGRGCCQGWCRKLLAH